jgi:hypothetical protein
VLLYHDAARGGLDFSRPHLAGFGVARRGGAEERTVDTRDGESPLGLWLNPELRRAGGEHVRARRRHDVYSLGLVLFEIGMWQDLSVFDDGGAAGRDLHAEVVRVCSARMAHKMGVAYRNAVVACLDSDDLWMGGDEDEDGDDGFVQTFLDKVVLELRKFCSEAS